jgi:hypothetical protein
MAKSKFDYQMYLNEMGIPFKDRKSEGGRIPDLALYGSWLKRNDPIAFEVGYNDWK